MPETSRIASRRWAGTAGRPVAEVELLLTGLAVWAYGVALGLADGEAQAGERLQAAIAAACQGFAALAAGEDGRLWFLGLLLAGFPAPGQADPGPTDSGTDLEDTPDLLLYARSGAAGWPTTGAEPAAALLDRLGPGRVIQALRRLPGDYRIVCTLYFMADLSYEEIARVLQYPVGTVRARLHRARKMLQKSLWQVAEAEGLGDGPGDPSQ
ncbi:MAG TPA: sigma-70 family RNA polymerase sigma factor [Gemmatimonadales bacterium]|nr:sigma-70 family RNA polymerase sigma factor [Gemmatimonadales bacterium]